MGFVVVVLDGWGKEWRSTPHLSLSSTTPSLSFALGERYPTHCNFWTKARTTRYDAEYEIFARSGLSKAPTAPARSTVSTISIVWKMCQDKCMFYSPLYLKLTNLPLSDQHSTWRRTTSVRASSKDGMLAQLSVPARTTHCCAGSVRAKSYCSREKDAFFTCLCCVVLHTRSIIWARSSNYARQCGRRVCTVCTLSSRGFTIPSHGLGFKQSSPSIMLVVDVESQHSRTRKLPSS